MGHLHLCWQMQCVQGTRKRGFKWTSSSPYLRDHPALPRQWKCCRSVIPSGQFLYMHTLIRILKKSSFRSKCRIDKGLIKSSKAVEERSSKEANRLEVTVQGPDYCGPPLMHSFIHSFIHTGIWWGALDWIDLAQDKVQCRVFVNMVMNLHVP
jgi:hypothetical protein